MKIYEAPHAQIVSFENDYVATGIGDGGATVTGLLYEAAGTCTWSTGDHILFDCGSSGSNKSAS